jgi:hypothetical protein
MESLVKRAFIFSDILLLLIFYNIFQFYMSNCYGCCVVIKFAKLRRASLCRMRRYAVY